MIGLEKITGRITSRAEEDAAQLLATAGEKCSQIEAEADAKIADERKKISDSLISECENIITRAKASAVMQKRNIILKAKCQALETAFENAENQLCALPREKYIPFILRYAGAAVDFTPDVTSCSVKLNAKDRADIGDELISSLSREYPSVVFTLSPGVADISGGALLDFGDTDVDCSVHTLLGLERGDLEPKICSILFEDAFR